MILRLATLADLEALMVLYRRKRSVRLPAPSLRILDETIAEDGLVLVIEAGNGRLAAVSATFGFAPRSAASYVGELSGTAVTGLVGGCRPFSAQRLLVAARLLLYAINPPKAGSAASLISIVESTNAASVANLEGAGLGRMATRPDWFRYEELAWHGCEVTDDWLYFFAEDDCVRRAFRDLEGVGFFGPDGAALERDDLEGGGVEAVSVRNGIPALAAAVDDLTAVADGRPVGLVEPPAELALADDPDAGRRA